MPSPVLQRQLPATIPQPSALTGEDLRLLGEWADTSQVLLNQLYSEIIWVYRAVFIIANNISRLPKKIVQTDDDGNEVDISSSPAFRIFKKPNFYQTPYDFWMESISRLKMQGELFWLKQYDRSNIVALYADWKSEKVEIVGHPTQFIDHFNYAYPGRRERFEREDVFFIKYFNPHSQLRGMSPLQPARHDATLELNAVNYQKKFFGQGMKFSGVLETNEPMQEEEARRVKEKFEQIYAGTEKMHQLAVTWGGFSFRPLNNMTLQEAQLNDTRKMSRSAIAGLFGVPEEIMGFGKDTWDNFKTAMRVFWSETLIPEITKIESLVNTFLMPELLQGQRNSENIRFKMDLSNVEALREDRTKKAQDYNRGFTSGSVTPNDIRVDVFGKNAINTPEMNSTYLEANMIPIGEVTAQRERLSTISNIKDKAFTVVDRDKLWHEKVAKLESSERLFTSRLKNFFSDQEEEIIKNMKDQLSELKSKKRKPKQVEVEGQIFDSEKWIEEALKIGNPIILDTVRRAAEEIIDVDFDLTDPGIREALGQRLARYSIDINETTRKSIIEIIRRVYAEGQDIPAIIKTLETEFKEYFESARQNRASKIARTEVVGANNYGTQKGMEVGGFERKMWLTSRDADVRSTHQIDGQVVNVGDDFTLTDGRKTPFPQDPNERCFHTPTNEPLTQT